MVRGQLAALANEVAVEMMGITFRQGFSLARGRTARVPSPLGQIKDYRRAQLTALLLMHSISFVKVIKKLISILLT